MNQIKALSFQMAQKINVPWFKELHAVLLEAHASSELPTYQPQVQDGLDNFAFLKRELKVSTELQEWLATIKERVGSEMGQKKHESIVDEYWTKLFGRSIINRDRTTNMIWK